MNSLRNECMVVVVYSSSRKVIQPNDQHEKINVG